MKKALSLVLAVLMVLGMTSVAFAANLEKADFNGGGYTLGDVSLELDEAVKDAYYPGDKVKVFILVREAGVDTILGTADDVISPLAKTAVDYLKLTAQVKVAGSNTYIKNTSPSIKYNTAKEAYFEIEFIKPFVSTSSKDFEITAYLRENKSQSGIETVINSTFKNYGQTVVDGDDYVYGVDYRVITADDNIRKIEVELDYGLTITTRMTEGKKYYGHVSMDPTSGDEAIMDQYPTIVEVYNLKTIGLNPAGDVVRFADDAMFAYTTDADGALVFLGKTNKALPYFTKYFLSTTELNLPVAEVEEPEEVVPEIDPIGPGTDNAATGGDDVVVANVNDNPGTGC